MTHSIRLGGVPEHFNLPILLAVERGEFTQQGIELRWSYYPGGTGAMIEALREGTLDMAILLTEGMVAAVAQGLQARVVKVYISSPLVWGIYTGAASGILSPTSPTRMRYAISRLGSGSHLMAMIHADRRGTKLREDDFEIVKSLEGAMESLTAGRTQLFYWERLMTKEYVTRGVVRQVGEFAAPWSSFLIVATDAALADHHSQIHTILQYINHIALHFRQDSTFAIELHRRFDMNEQEIAQWLDSTHWSTDYHIPLQGLREAGAALERIGIPPIRDVEGLCGG